MVWKGFAFLADRASGFLKGLLDGRLECSTLQWGQGSNRCEGELAGPTTFTFSVKEVPKAGFEYSVLLVVRYSGEVVVVLGLTVEVK